LEAGRLGSSKAGKLEDWIARSAIKPSRLTASQPSGLPATKIKESISHV